MNQKNFQQIGMGGPPPQSNHEDEREGAGDPTRLEHSPHLHVQDDAATHCDKKKQPKDEKIGFIVTCYGTKDPSPPGYRVVGSPLGLPPRLPCIPPGQIVAHKEQPPSWPKRKKHLYEETASYTGYDHEEQERPFKRIRPHEQEPCLHMVSP